MNGPITGQFSGFLSHVLNVKGRTFGVRHLRLFIEHSFAKKQTWKVREWMTVWVWTHGGASINKCCIISICQKNVAIHTWRCHFSQCRRSDLERGRQQRALWLTFHGGNTGNKGKKKKKTQVKTECVWTSNTVSVHENGNDRTRRTRGERVRRRGERIVSVDD